MVNSILGFLFVTITFLFASPICLSSIWGHLGAAALSIYGLRYISGYYIFWLGLFASVLLASEPRFSLEYYILAFSFLALGNSTGFKKINNHKNVLLAFFILLIILNQLKITFYERGSVLLWLPVYLALYYEAINKSNFMVYLFSGLSLTLSNKMTSILAFLATLRSKILYFIAFLIFVTLLFIKNIPHFIETSVTPRVYIWKSAVNGALFEPITGHGFGTFALDFPVFRAHAPVLGGRLHEQIMHGHSSLFHYAFELGLVGVFFICVILYLIFVNARKAFLPTLIIVLFDASLVTFNQFFLAGILLLPFIKDLGVFKNLFATLPNKHKLFHQSFACTIALLIYIPSLMGYFYYDKGDYDSAIKWDRYNSLYYFTRGSMAISKNLLAAEKDLQKATDLTPSISYYHGFLAATQLGLRKYFEAEKNINFAIKHDGTDGYWYFIKALIKYDTDHEFAEYYKKAIKRNPEIEEIIEIPYITSGQYIGNTRGGDSRLSAFYRSGPEIFFPLPVINKDDFKKKIKPKTKKN